MKHQEAHRTTLNFQGSTHKHRLQHTQISVSSLHKFCVQISWIPYFTLSQGRKQRPEPFPKHIKTPLLGTLYSNI